jgi:site-specific recombinase
MKHLDCEQKLKNGNFCSKTAYKINGQIYCDQHWKIINDKKEKNQNNQNNHIEWTEEMDNYSKSKTVIELKQFLREKGLKVGGTKKELITRIFSYN